MKCFSCGQGDSLPLFRERNKGRIFCGESCQRVGASWWLDFKRLNKVTIGKTQRELDPGLVWNMIKLSGMTRQQIADDFLNYDDYTDVFKMEGPRDPVTQQRRFMEETRRDNITQHNEALKTMLLWLYKNRTFFDGNIKNASGFFQTLLRQAIRQHNVVIVQFLLDDIPSYDDFWNDDFKYNFAIGHAAILNATEVVKLLLRYPQVDLNSLPTPLAAACTNGSIETVRLLLNDERTDPAADGNKAIRQASSFGYAAIVAMLLKDKRADPSANDNESIRKASEKGYTEVVALLLQDPRVNPSANYNEAIQVASKAGYAEIVRLLLKDPRVNPAALSNQAVRHASSNGHADVVRMLLQDPRVDPSDDDNYAIQVASKKGHAEVVRTLLQDRRVDPSVGGNYAIRYASGNGHADVVRILLQDPRVDPSADDNGAIRSASSAGREEVVRILLQDKRVDPSADDNFAIRRASIMGYAEVIRILLQNARVLSKMDARLFEKLTERHPGISKEIDAARVSWSRMKALEGTPQEEKETPAKRVKEKINLFSL